MKISWLLLYQKKINNFAWLVTPYHAVDFYGLSKRIRINIFIFSIISNTSKYKMN